MKNPVGADDAKLFDAFVAKWQSKLSLMDWRIERGLKPAKGAMACVDFDEDARLVTYRLGDFGGEEITPRSLETTAVHELLHVLLHDLIEAADARSGVEAAEHRVINVLERLLMERA